MEETQGEKQARMRQMLPEEAFSTSSDQAALKRGGSRNLEKELKDQGVSEKKAKERANAALQAKIAGNPKRPSSEQDWDHST